MIHVVTRTTTVEGPRLKLNCPNCEARGIAAGSADVTAKEFLFGVIPVTTNHWATITCGACQRSFRLRNPTSELAAMTPEQLSELAASRGMAYTGNLIKFCILISVVLGIFPFVGLIFALIGLIGTHNRRTKWRIAAWVGLIISLLSSGLGLAAILMQKK